ncbi:MAG: hypothetical protein ACR65O_05540 [Methylomicrobium sp.]|jgi:hypothetical protein
MKFITLLILTGLMFSMNTPAEEKLSKLKLKLFTPTLWAQQPNFFACNLTNVSDDTRTIQVRIISNGAILDDSGEVPVEPLHTANYYIPGLPDRGGPIFCEFTVEGPKKWYRGAAKLFPAENNPTTDLVAIPAE